jgi:hypothetical protein
VVSFARYVPKCSERGARGVDMLTFENRAISAVSVGSGGHSGKKGGPFLLWGLQGGCAGGDCADHCASEDWCLRAVA